jgi:hypothetical protein
MTVQPRIKVGINSIFSREKRRSKPAGQVGDSRLACAVFATQIDDVPPMPACFFQIGEATSRVVRADVISILASQRDVHFSAKSLYIKILKIN